MTFVRKKHTPFAAGAKVCNAIQGPLSDKKSLWDAALSAVGSISRVPLKPQPQGALGSTRKNAILVASARSCANSISLRLGVAGWHNQYKAIAN
jgi:hypothetical protein